MSKHRFLIFERRAIWESFGKRCAYTTEPISWNDLQIDHIIPKTLATDSAACEAAKAAYDLPAEFDINSFYNLLPTKAGLNRQKGSHVLGESAIRYFLDLAHRNFPRTRDLAVAYESAANQEGLLASLAAAIEAGRLTGEDAIRYVEGMLVGEERFQLTDEFESFGTASSELISRADIERLLVAPIFEDGLELIDDSDRRIFVCTCEEFLSAEAARRSRVAYRRHEGRERLQPRLFGIVGRFGACPGSSGQLFIQSASRNHRFVTTSCQCTWKHER